MFVGVGAGPACDMFENAKEKCPPCIIFIDEIDAVKRQRGAGSWAAGMMSVKQTLNRRCSSRWTVSRPTCVIVGRYQPPPTFWMRHCCVPVAFDRQGLCDAA